MLQTDQTDERTQMETHAQTEQTDERTDRWIHMDRLNKQTNAQTDGYTRTD